MRVFLNLPAIVLIVLFYGLTYLLNYISPEFKNFDHPYYWVAFYILCGIGELNSLRGRIFFIPMWLIGIIGFIATSISVYEKTGLLSGLVLSLGIFAVGYMLMKLLNQKKWSRAQESLVFLKTSSKGGIESSLFYENLKKSFFVPSYLNPDNYLLYLIMEKLFDLGYKGNFNKPEVNKHYQDFIEFFREHITEEDYKKYVAVFHNSLKKIMESKPVNIQQYMFDNINMLIEQKEKILNLQLEAVKKTNK